LALLLPKGVSMLASAYLTVLAIVLAWRRVALWFLASIAVSMTWRGEAWKGAFLEEQEQLFQCRQQSPKTESSQTGAFPGHDGALIVLQSSLDQPRFVILLDDDHTCLWPKVSPEANLAGSEAPDNRSASQQETNQEVYLARSLSVFRRDDYMPPGGSVDKSSSPQAWGELLSNHHKGIHPANIIRLTGEHESLGNNVSKKQSDDQFSDRGDKIRGGVHAAEPTKTYARKTISKLAQHQS
jgi:hypothetical protein